MASLKIHILGGPGSGKTTLATELAARLHIPHYDLDMIGWRHGDREGRPCKDTFQLYALLK